MGGDPSVRSSVVLKKSLVGSLCGLGVLLVVVLGSPSPASAHAYLESSQPVQSSVVLIAPHNVVLNFDEPVEIDFGSLRVIGPNGQRVDAGGAHHPGNTTSSVAISLSSRLPRGTYVVAWRVISADSHPVHGAFIFSVGSAGAASKASATVAQLNKESGSTVVGVIFWVVRVGAFAGLLLLVGIAAIIFLVWRDGAHARRVRKMLWTSWWVLLVSSLLGIAVQGVYASELPITDVFRPNLWNEVLHTRFGEVELLRLILLAAVLPVLLSLHRDIRKIRWIIAVGAVGLVGLLFTPGLSGHAATGSDVPLSMALDVLHLGAVSLWLGGLALLAALLIPGMRAVEPASIGRIALSTSAFAFAAVVVVIATGVVQSIRQVGSFYALTNTVYGRTLIVKIALVVVLVGVGAVSRSIVLGHRLPWQRSSDLTHWGEKDRPKRLRRTVCAELAIAFAVLGVTGLLVNAAPARQAASQPFTRTFSVLGVQVNSIIAPAHVGPNNEVHFYVLGRFDQPIGIPELDAAISLPSEGIGPLAIPLVLAGPGHYQANRFDLPFAGNWDLKLTIRTSPIDEQEVFAKFPVH